MATLRLMSEADFINARLAIDQLFYRRFEFRPTRERENLVGEQTRLINRIKSCLVRFGIRGFKSKLRKAAERLEALRTPDGVALAPNTLAELRRDLARLRFVRDQIKTIEVARLQRLKNKAPKEGSHAMVCLLVRVIGIGVETADARGGTRKTMIVALARKLLIALWRLVTSGEIPNGVILRPAV